MMKADLPGYQESGDGSTRIRKGQEGNWEAIHAEPFGVGVGKLAA